MSASSKVLIAALVLLALVFPLIGSTQQRAGVVELKPRGPGNVPLPAAVNPQDYFALIIAPPYGPEWQQLPTPQPEAAALAELLSGSFGFDVKVLNSHSETTGAQLTREIRDLPKRENVLVFFSGHGKTDSADITYWVPSDGTLKDSSSWLSHDFVKRHSRALLLREEVKHILIISDSCFAGDLVRGATYQIPLDSEDWPKWLEDKYREDSLQALTSGGNHPVTGGTGCISDGRKLGYFSCALERALKDPGREVWTAHGLYWRVLDLMDGVDSSENEPQAPRLFPATSKGEFLFVRRKLGHVSDSLPSSELVIEVVPEEADLRVGGYSLNQKMTDGQIVVKLDPGTYLVEAELEGYEPFADEVDLPAGESVGLRIELPVLPGPAPVPTPPGSGFGILYVKSTPPEGEIVVDGQATGLRTPATLEKLPAGAREVSIRLRNHHLWEKTTDVFDGEVRIVNAELKPAFGGLRVTSEPSGALLYLNGRQVGSTSWSNLELASNSYSVRLVSSCYRDLETVALVQDGEETALNLSMQPSCGDLLVETRPPGAGVSIDGVGYQQSPVRFDDVPEGDHIVNVTLDMHVPESESLTVTAGREARLVIDLSPTFGTVEIRSQPSGAEVVALDGSILGETPFTRRYEAGPFVADVRLEWHATRRVELYVVVGETVEDMIPLDRLMSKLTVLTDPDGAELWLDGRQVGFSPVTIRDVTVGEHELVATKDQLKVVETIAVAADKANILRLTLGRVSPEPGDLWVDSGIGMRFRYIPAGAFVMGSPADEPGRFGNETQHRVKITRGYWMGETEVTQGQWKSLMGSNPSKFSSCGDECPVEMVNWWEAVSCANALSRKAGLQECYRMTGCQKSPGNDMECNSASFVGLSCEGYRLPTEAEWEHAARAGGSHQYPGSNDIGSVAWYDDNSGRKTHRVGQKQANAGGLRDMSGNVWEWCHDWQGDYPGSSVTDPTGPSSGASRVRRGGSWGSIAEYCRSADRFRNFPGFRDYFLGFRLVRTAP